MNTEIKNIMNMQPFEGKFLLFVAEAGKGAQSVIEQGAAKQILFTRTCPSLRKRPQQTLDRMSDLHLCGLQKEEGSRQKMSLCPCRERISLVLDSSPSEAMIARDTIAISAPLRA